MTENQKFIKLDEEGYLLNDDGLRIEDLEYGKSVLSSLRHGPFETVWSDRPDKDVLVEAFDSPLVIRHLEVNGLSVHLHGPYETEFKALLTDFYLDFFDRFHGVTNEGVQFVLSRTAQSELFNQVEDFEDEALIQDGQTIETKDWIASKKEVSQAKYWSERYQNEKTGWELGVHHPAIPSILSQINPPKSKILVLGAGSGNDAAFFASRGHQTLAVDFSPEAIAQAKTKYPENDLLKYREADVFDLGEKDFGSYDLIFEHTCFAAIDPMKRSALVDVWKKCLRPGGHLLAIFFATEKREGPPYGSSEWELKQRLKKDFQFLYWTRWKKSPGPRLGAELIVYAQKK